MKPPGPGPLELIVGTRQRGFIGFAEACWRKYGDTFQIRVPGMSLQPRTIVMMAPYLSHRHPEFWRDPERFDPDRWAAPNAGQNRAYHPFGGGQRVCIGNSFSLLETHILVAILAQRFAPQLRPGYQPRWAMQGVLGLKGGLPMRIAARPVS
jgi:cytochrome P450